VARRIVDVDAPDRFTAAEEPGDEDDCYLEVVRRRRRLSVSLEREQLAGLADGILRLVDELERRGLVAIDIGSVEAPSGRIGRRHAFRAETLTLDWDEDGQRVVIEARSPEPGGAGESAPLPPMQPDADVEEVGDDDPLGPDVLRVRLTPHMAQRFARQAARLAGGSWGGPRADGPAGADRQGA
jgi:uncharacterized repeat protein (TIGR03847 family)